METTDEIPNNKIQKTNKFQLPNFQIPKYNDQILSAVFRAYKVVGSLIQKFFYFVIP